jgi:metal-responsive CopG/Arc/MetJ family transcriptional regulator
MAVSSARRRAHVVLPAELLNEIDERVGPRKRSEFIQEAIEDKLNVLRRVEAFERAIAEPTVGIPEWETRESTAAWVRQMREGSSERIRALHWLPEPE